MKKGHRGGETWGLPWDWNQVHGDAKVESKVRKSGFSHQQQGTGEVFRVGADCGALNGKS